MSKQMFYSIFAIITQNTSAGSNLKIQKDTQVGGEF